MDPFEMSFRSIEGAIYVRFNFLLTYDFHQVKVFEVECLGPIDINFSCGVEVWVEKGGRHRNRRNLYEMAAVLISPATNDA